MEYVILAIVCGRCESVIRKCSYHGVLSTVRSFSFPTTHVGEHLCLSRFQSFLFRHYSSARGRDMDAKNYSVQ